MKQVYRIGFKLNGVVHLHYFVFENDQQYKDEREKFKEKYVNTYNKIEYLVFGIV